MFKFGIIIALFVILTIFSFHICFEYVQFEPEVHEIID
jgi:hypothetical protein